jgi:GAF domain-containing protein
MPDYKLLCEQAEALSEDAAWDMTVLANVSALLYGALEHLNWAGFYLIREGELVLGPFQGKPACTRIPVGKGVCGTAVREERVIRVDNVHEFPGHIACDSASESEIVLPLRKGGEIIGVLDIDSIVRNRFSAEDEAGLSDIVRIVEKYIWAAGDTRQEAGEDPAGRLRNRYGSDQDGLPQLRCTPEAAAGRVLCQMPLL